MLSTRWNPISRVADRNEATPRLSKIHCVGRPRWLSSLGFALKGATGVNTGVPNNSASDLSSI
jgi:hypothetical protein